MAEMVIRRRIFVVGCARSGTTLLQAMLGSHSEIHAFPETFYFLDSRPAAVPGVLHWFRRARSSRYAYESALRRLESGQSHAPLYLGPTGLSKRFIRTLDGIALAAGKTIWSEKTPGHINCVEQIEDVIPDALFVHVLRDGRDVVASLEHLYRERALDPARPAPGWPLHEAISRWNAAVEVSRSCQGRQGHHLVSYQALVDCPEAVLESLCDFVGVGYEPAMVEYYRTASGVLGGDIDQEWRTDVLDPLKSTHLKKYAGIFNESEQQRIEQLLLDRGRVAVAAE